MSLNFAARRGLWILWGLLLALVIVGSLAPGVVVQRVGLPTSGFSDKCLHFSGFCLLSLLPALRASTSRRRLLFVTAMLTLAMILELTQSMVPGRSSDFWDLQANNLGVVTGLMLASLLRTIIPL